MNLLVVEDNQLVATNIAEYLEGAGHDVDLAVDGKTGLKLACARAYDAIVLDVMLPRLSGFDVCRSYRRERGATTPILVLTALDTLEDKVQGFDAGADDYLVKPFELRELLMRLEALHRRSAGSQHASSDVLQFEDVEFDLGSWAVRRRGRELELNRIGKRILELLLRAAPNVVSQERVMQDVWGEHPPSAGVLRTHVYALRKALAAAAPDGEEILETVRGIGYRLVPATDRDAS